MPKRILGEGLVVMTEVATMKNVSQKQLSALLVNGNNELVVWQAKDLLQNIHDCTGKLVDAKAGAPLNPPCRGK